MATIWRILSAREGIELFIEISYARSVAKIVTMSSITDRNSISFPGIAENPSTDARITKPFVPDSLMPTISLLTSIQ